ncbi:hypothetical protein CP061683_0885 [Chlamydia psittaci 06-1683]|nr:hypothetical protein CP061683_0885 [Chlamydia psittaci 06-1683]
MKERNERNILRFSVFKSKFKMGFTSPDFLLISSGSLS